MGTRRQLVVIWKLQGCNTKVAISSFESFSMEFRRSALLISQKSFTQIAAVLDMKASVVVVCP